MKGDSREGPEEGTDACRCSGTNTAASPRERAGKGETESRDSEGCCNDPGKGRGGRPQGQR